MNIFLEPIMQWVGLGWIIFILSAILIFWLFSRQKRAAIFRVLLLSIVFGSALSPVILFIIWVIISGEPFF